MLLEQPSDAFCYISKSGTPVESRLAALDNALNKESVDDRTSIKLPNEV